MAAFSSPTRIETEGTQVKRGADGRISLSCRFYLCGVANSSSPNRQDDVQRAEFIASMSRDLRPDPLQDNLFNLRGKPLGDFHVLQVMPGF